MVLKSNDNMMKYFIYDNIFTPDECELIVNSNHWRETEVKPASGYQANANVYYFYDNKQTEWIKNRISNSIKEVNDLYYQFEYSFFEELKMIEYFEGYHFNWHIDIQGMNENFPKRKLQSVTFLTDPKDYEGGKLRFNMAAKIPTIDLPQLQGSTVFYPSYMAHKVEPVTKGRRCIISAIVNGTPFR
mgnify:FL=1